LGFKRWNGATIGTLMVAFTPEALVTDRRQQVASTVLCGAASFAQVSFKLTTVKSLLLIDPRK
jgi:hypothetical protein